MALLEGLEVSEVRFSELEYTRRIDAEYYKPYYIKYEEKIKSKNSGLLQDFSNFLIGPFGSAFTVDNYTLKKEFRYIRGKDVKPLRLKDDDNVYMPKEDYNRLSKYALSEGDILVSVVGTVGNAAIVTEKDLPAIFSCKSTVLRPFSIDSVYLLTYINSKYGRELLQRKERGTIQKGLNLGDLQNLDVYIPTNEFQEKIRKIFHISFKKSELAKLIYDQTETLLLDHLGLKNYNFSNVPLSNKYNIDKSGVNIKTLASYQEHQRLDAEYYQAKYERFHNQVEESVHQKGWKIIKLKDLVDDLKYGSSTKLEYVSTGVPFLRIADLENNQFNKKSVKYISRKAAIKESSATVRNGDILISRSGTLGLTIPIKEEFAGAIYGSYFIRLSGISSMIDKDYFALFFNSLCGKIQIEQINTGGIQTNLTIPAIQSLYIVIPPLEIQNEIVHIQTQSRELEHTSNKLLETAKRAVEIAIEQDETTAIKFLKSQSELGIRDTKIKLA